MNFAELQAEVILITKRPDLATLTASAVRTATLKAHQLDFFSKDIFEFTVTFPTAEYITEFEYKVSVPRWRASQYIRKIDSTTDLPYGDFLSLIDARDALDKYQIYKEDVYYEAGQTLRIRTREQVSKFLIGCYLHPDTAPDTYNSWIANDFPWAIIYDAAATVHKSTGFTEQENSMRGLAAEQFALLKISNVLAEGS